MDIPLEDMSKKPKPAHPSVTKISARRSLSDESDSGRIRSSSYSPVRSRSSSNSPRRHTPPRRSRALSESSQVSPSSSRERRSSSHMSPKRGSRSSSRKNSQERVTSFMTNPGGPAEDLFPTGSVSTPDNKGI